MTAASDASGRAPAEDCEVERRLHRQQQNAGVQIGGFVRGIRAVDLQHAMSTTTTEKNLLEKLYQEGYDNVQSMRDLLKEKLYR